MASYLDRPQWDPHTAGLWDLLIICSSFAFTMPHYHIVFTGQIVWHSCRGKICVDLHGNGLLSIGMLLKITTLQLILQFLLWLILLLFITRTVEIPCLSCPSFAISHWTSKRICLLNCPETTNKKSIHMNIFLLKHIKWVLIRRASQRCF